MQYSICGNWLFEGQVAVAISPYSNPHGGIYYNIVNISSWSTGVFSEYGQRDFTAPGTAGIYFVSFKITENTYGSPAIGYYDFFLTVNAAPSATVSVEVRKVGGSWSKSANVSVGDTVEVQWKPTNATGCSCTYNGTQGDCGYGKGNPQPSTPIQFTVTKNTTFSVHCDP